MQKKKKKEAERVAPEDLIKRSKERFRPGDVFSSDLREGRPRHAEESGGQEEEEDGVRHEVSCRERQTRGRLGATESHENTPRLSSIPSRDSFSSSSSPTSCSASSYSRRSSQLPGEQRRQEEMPFYNEEDRCVIIGADADLIVQALAFPGVPRLFVYNPQQTLQQAPLPAGPLGASTHAAGSTAKHTRSTSAKSSKQKKVRGTRPTARGFCSLSLCITWWVWGP